MDQRRINRQSTGIRGLIAVAITLAMLLSALGPALRVTAQDDVLTQREFDLILDDTRQTEPVFGPESGDLKHDADVISFETSDPDVADFLVEVTFQNPVAAEDHFFDYGIQFRTHNDSGEDRFLMFIVIETGEWALFDGFDNLLGNGAYDDFDGGRRGENALSVYAVGDQAHLGINGDYLGTVEVPFDAAGEVLIGTAFYSDSTIEDGITEYSDFTIWEVAGAEPDSGPVTEDRNDNLGRVDEGATDNDGRNDDLEPVATDEPTDTPREDPIETATEEQTEEPEPTEEPEATETPVPTEEPTEEPEATETPVPTEEPTEEPEATETPEPTDEPTEEPVATATEAPTIESTAGPVDTTLYVESQYGYSIAYDVSWTVLEQSGALFLPSILLTNGTSDLEIAASPADPAETTDRAVVDVIEHFGATEDVLTAVVAVDDSGHELRGRTVSGSFVVLDVVTLQDNGEIQDVTYYLEFRRIPRQNAMLSIVHSAPAADYQSEIPARQSVINTLRFGEQ